MTLEDFLCNAISQALDDMGKEYSVSPATKEYLDAALRYAETRAEPQYDSRLGTWTFTSPEEATP